MKNFKNIVVPAFILTAICLALTALLAFTNLITSPVIAQKNKESENNALKEVIDADNFKEILNTSNLTAYSAHKNNSLVGHCFKSTVYGYGGDVTAIIGIKGGKITSVVITDVSGETPGLGQNAVKRGFLDQFNDKQNTENFEAITGATITSTAAKTAINNALLEYERMGLSE